MLVHDPAAAGALDALADVPEDELESRCLFKSRPDSSAFAEQHARFVATVADAGAYVLGLRDLLRETDLWPLVAANPNQVYTRDGAITLPWLPHAYIRGAMRMPTRRDEPAVLAAALSRLGLEELFAAPADCFLEGGDVVPVSVDGRRALLVGYGPRTCRAAVELLWERLAPWALDVLIGVRLPDWRMNLDGALVPVAEGLAVVHPASIEDAFLRDDTGERPVDPPALLAELGFDAIEVTRQEATASQACNILCLGEGSVVCYDLSPRVAAALGDRGLVVRTVDGSELIKGTGGPRCMTRPVYT